jgi:3-methylfumaryl-CoA hydratase
MWAGSRIRYLADLPIEAQATRRSRILKIENKAGKRGSLWFVTVEHVISCDGTPLHLEEQDIVYREIAPGLRSAYAVQRYDGVPQWSRTSSRTRRSVSLFGADLQRPSHPLRSAYAREQEGYPDLVVHGPLTATLLQQFALDHGAGRALARFDFRGVTPLFVGRTFQLEGRQVEDGTLALWARGPDGELAMSATAAFR